ncbi:MAG: hypothetical protein ABJH07_10440 [Sedimentitalea sp.]|uniref:hypothetical protein n=1 Tax=Sedimentitalea sp. TaxID=2048915 RepID=UPI003266831F
MSAEATLKSNQSLQGSRLETSLEAEIAALEHAPTGAPMETRHWVFLGISGIVLPVLVLLWGWT